MAIILITHPQPKLYTRFMLHGYGRVETDAAFRGQLRLMVAVLLAQWSDTNPDLSGITGELFDMVTSEKFYSDGYNKSSKGNDVRLWFSSYVGFEKVTSVWAKEKYPGCYGYLCMRIYNQDSRHNLMDSHTIIIYF